MSSEGYGSLLRGRINQYKSQQQPMIEEGDMSHQINRQIEILPKTKRNVNRKMRNKVISGSGKSEDVILMQSGVFPAIYFKKTTMRNILKEFTFPDNVRALPQKDDRMQLIFQIVANLFSEITFVIFDILVGENLVTGSFYIFFSDSETIPYTKCCNAPVYIEFMQNGSGKILCNCLKCPHSSIAQFFINFEDGRKLWKNVAYFADASEKDKELRSRISKLIINGKYKNTSLVNVVQDTSKEIVDLFYNGKEGNREKSVMEEKMGQPVDSSVPMSFITGYEQQEQSKEKEKQKGKESGYRFTEMTLEDILSPEEGNVDILKMKLHYMVRNSKDLVGKVTKNLVNEGKVFHKNFEMIRKIDEFMLTNKNRTGKINFPMLVDQMRKDRLSRKEERRERGKSMIGYNSFG